MKHKKTQAIILAAGLGSRLNNITMSIPKTMIKIRDKYVYENILEAVAKTGIKDVIFVVGYQHKKLLPLLTKTSKKLKLNLNIVKNDEYKMTNTMYSFWLARHLINGPIVYIHGDLLFNHSMLIGLMETGSHNAILVDDKFPLDWGDAMKVISHRNMLKYMSKGITVNEMDGTAVGIYKFNYKAVKDLIKISEELIYKGVRKSWISEAINILLKSTKINVVCNSNNYHWVDIDNMVDLNMADKIYSEVFSI